MSGTCELSFQHRSLVQQGYENLTPQQLRELEWGLRFTPATCALIALYGLLTHQPLVLFAVAVLGVWAFLAPAHHPMDLLYNHVVRPMFGATPLPPNPLQRRLACLSSAVMNSAAGALLMAGLVYPAYAVGGLLLVFQVIVITTHFCALSYVYEFAAKLFGSWNRPVDAARAQELLASGAALVDVRSPQEFSTGHLEGALNFPVETIEGRVEELPASTLLVYCKSGMRANVAIGLLRKRGLDGAHNLGSMEQARSLLAR